MIQIVLADDHQVVREGFRHILEAEPDFTVVGEAGDGSTAVEMVKQLHPTVFVMDMVMPGMTGLDVLAQVGECSPQTRTVVLSMYDEQDIVLYALRSGAMAYVLKQSSAQELIQALRAVVSGRYYLSLPLVGHVIKAYLRQPLMSTVQPDSAEALSPRERDVLRRIAHGQTSRRIAAELSISPRTVETFRRRLMHKLCLHSQTELVQFALRHML